MQDVHPIGGGGGDSRRLRPNQQQTAAELKCPRCDSLNTKFCYYNNYNLSQPRHFCKSCRRYWTKGGVLRNVPVGGGCRKTKRRSNHKATESSNSHSSSGSSGITATAAAAAGTTEVVSESANPNTPSLDQALMDHSTDGQIFQELGSFTTLMTSPEDLSLIDTFRLQHSFPEKGVVEHSLKAQWGPHPKMDGEDGEMQEITAAGFLDDATQSRRSNGGLSPLDWQIGGAHGGLFDLTGAVDQSYWNDDHTFNHSNSLQY